MLGGDVGVESIPGKGSRFWLELTLAGGAVAFTTAVSEAGPVPTPVHEPPSLPAGALPVDLLTSLAQVEALLQAFDTRAGPVLREAAPRLRRHFGAQVDVLDRLIAAFDYDQALERLKALSQQGDSAS
jgi:hypothetical protein